MKNKIKKTNKISNRKVTIDELALMIKSLNKSIPLKVDKSIEEFAVVVGKGFAGVDERFAKMDERFDKMDERMDKMDDKIDKIDERMSRMELKLDSLERRIFAIEDLLTEHRNILNEHGKDIKEIKEELKIIKKTGGSNSEKIIEMDKKIRVLESKVSLTN